MKKILLSKNTKIFILAPTNTSTGGPECLHQLAKSLKNIFKIKDIFMVYLPQIDGNPVHKNYKGYKIKYSNTIEDNEDNLLIIPEHFSFLKYSLKFLRLKKIIWWLSVDNYFGYKFRSENHKLLRSLIKIPYNLISLFNRITKYKFGIFTLQEYLQFYYKFIDISEQKEVNQASFHLMQSYYAYDFFKQKLKNIKILYDYQNEKIILNSKNIKHSKENLICYSHKCSDFIHLVKEKSNNKFIKLQNYNQKQIIDIFKKTKIYIDFGYHPGKDKMPREAALFNNCIITNRRGSAKNSVDIPISNNFKFKEKKSNIQSIVNLINTMLNNYNSELKKFKQYKSKIKNEKKTFEKDLKKIFKKN